MNDQGSVSVVVVAVVACGLALAAGLAGVGQLLGAVAIASNAADAAALAAAPVTFRDFGSTGSPTDEARRFATVNGSKLVTCTCPRNATYGARTVVVGVVVAVDVLGLYATQVSATSAAEFRPVVLLAAS